MQYGAPERVRKAPKKVTRSISFTYAASAELSSLFEDFRLMCNDAIRVAMELHPTSRFKLIELAYPRLKEYGLHTHYILSACEVAFSVYRNKNRTRAPHIRRAFLKLDSQSYCLDHLLLRIPTKPRRFIYIILQGSDYHISFLDDPCLKRGSVTISSSKVSVAFSKSVAEFETRGSVGIDLNERNVTATDSSARTTYYDTSEVAEIRERYRDAKAKIGERTRQDWRVSKPLLAKYGRREKDRTVQRLHRVTKAIVDDAMRNQFGIVMENLKGIRKLYRKGNGQGTSFRGRMNSWTFRELQRQVEYKARWKGIPVKYVNPRGTSRKCPECGSRVVPLQERKLYCAECDRTWDRDVLASRNIMACAVPQARPPRGSGDGERGGDGSNPQSRWAEVGLGRRVPTS